MVLDKMEFADAQAITASTATDSTNVLDFEVASTKSDIGVGTPMWLVCRINTTFTDSSAASQAQVTLQHSAASASAFVQAAQGHLYSVGDLIKGQDMLTQALPADLKQHLKVVWTPTSSSGYNAGKIDAYLTTNAPLNQAGPGTGA